MRPRADLHLLHGVLWWRRVSVYAIGMVGILLILLLPLMAVAYILIAAFWALFTVVRLVGELACWVLDRLGGTTG